MESHTHTHQEAEKGMEHTKPHILIFGVHSLDDMRWPIGDLVQVGGASSKTALGTQGVLDTGV